MARSKGPGLDPHGYGPYEATLEDLMNDAIKPMRLFTLWRVEDESGVSGVGEVAQGVVFSDGTVTMRWLTEYKSTAVYDSIGDLETIHGHGGKTKVVWK